MAANIINKWIYKWAIRPTWLRVFIVVVLILGIFFRFANLDKKAYWIDETYTSLRISGYTETEFINQVFDNRVVSLEELQKYQHPNADKGLADTINSLAQESPQHPPLYYVMARLWVQWLGYSVTVIRSLSAVISLLLFPCIYWLCLELFNSPLTGWIAVALAATSPFHVLYAQEAREYSLWTVAIALSSAALLHVIRLKTKLSWIIYATTVALSLYSFTFSIFVIISHGIYVVINVNTANKPLRLITNYLLATFTGILAFSPWLLVIINNFSQVKDTADWTELKVAFGFLLQRWIVNLGNVFFDLNTGYEYLTLPHLALLVLGIYAIYFLVRNHSKKVWLFIIILIATTALTLILPDLIIGGIRSTNARYLIPFYLGVQLAVANLIATKITPISRNIKLQKFWQGVFIAIITGSILSCAVSSQAQLWWHKSPSKHKYNPEIAAIVNHSANPLLISDNSTAISSSFAARVLALSYLLPEKVKMQLVIEPSVPQIPNDFSNVFVFSPSKALITKIEEQENYKSRLVFQRNNFWLWELTKK